MYESERPQGQASQSKAESRLVGAECDVGSKTTKQAGVFQDATPRVGRAVRVDARTASQGRLLNPAQTDALDLPHH